MDRLTSIEKQLQDIINRDIVMHEKIGQIYTILTDKDFGLTGRVAKLETATFGDNNTVGTNEKIRTFVRNWTYFITIASFIISISVPLVINKFVLKKTYNQKTSEISSNINQK